MKRGLEAPNEAFMLEKNDINQSSEQLMTYRRSAVRHKKILRCGLTVTEKQEVVFSIHQLYLRFNFSALEQTHQRQVRNSVMVFIANVIVYFQYVLPPLL